MKYSMYFTKSAPGEAASAEGYLFQHLSLKPSETMDLGTTKGKPFRQ